MTRLIFVFTRRTCPGLRLWEITLPFFTFFERACLTVPTRQWLFVIAALAAASVFPVTFGTLHDFGGVEMPCTVNVCETGVAAL